MSLHRRAAIVGVHEFERRQAPDRSILQIQAECAQKALAEAGLSLRDVDAIYTPSSEGMSLPSMIGLIQAEYLNIHPRVIDSTSVGGASFLFHAHHAAAMIAAGDCEVALITYGSTALSQAVAIGTRGVSGDKAPPVPDSFEVPYGITTIGLYAIVAQRHMYQYGTTSEQLAEIAVVTRKHASLNPLAMFRDPITIADVLKSRMVSSPLHVLDCCIISDGGGAVVMTSAKRARTLKKPPVYFLGGCEAASHGDAGMRELTDVAAKYSGEVALKRAGVTHKDIDVACVYDSFTITVLTTLEDLGFCKKGQGGAFVQGGRIALGGELPLNPDGGGLSSCHPGMRGIFLLIEATKQLRGESGLRQVKDARTALCHGTGGSLGARHSGCTVILGAE